MDIVYEITNLLLWETKVSLCLCELNHVLCMLPTRIRYKVIEYRYEIDKQNLLTKP